MGAWIILIATSFPTVVQPAGLKTGHDRGLGITDLQNFTFDLGDSSSVDDGKVPLANGKWVDPDGGSTFTLALRTRDRRSRRRRWRTMRRRFSSNRRAAPAPSRICLR